MQAVIFFDLQAKLAYASQIYTIYGTNFSKEFVEKELVFDVEQVVKKYNRADLLVQSDDIEHLIEHNGRQVATLKNHEATSEIVERFNDAGAFNKIMIDQQYCMFSVLYVHVVQSVSFRDPSLVPERWITAIYVLPP